jgi:hypothetical protein
MLPIETLLLVPSGTRIKVALNNNFDFLVKALVTDIRDIHGFPLIVLLESAGVFQAYSALSSDQYSIDSVIDKENGFTNVRTK